MTEFDEPRGVNFIKDALAERLGRPAATRVAKSNPSEWYIFDPCFAVIQRGMGSDSKGYRSGIQINSEDISFFNVHSRTPAKLLRTNLKQRPEALINAAEGCLHLRDYHYLHYSSRKISCQTGAKKWIDTVRKIESSNWKVFKRELESELNGIVYDLFPELPSVGKAGTGESVRGSDFCLLLADYHRIEFAKTDEIAAQRATEVIDAAWHLFSCLYPWESPKKRDASLRRAMLSNPGLCNCEYDQIVGAPKLSCDGLSVEAAHIIPYARGGSDRSWNGIWLCKKHHRITEGRLAGYRDRSDLSRVQVRFLT
ncbi:MAG: HNH endonuclease signature motif containing protein [Cyanobacteria bacterium P01_A01_bin.15]